MFLPTILLLISGVSSRYLQCPKSNGKFPVENSDCRSYYECENWKVTNHHTCPNGQSFNPTLQWCDYEELYYCVEKEIKKYKICKKASGKFPKENSDCRGFYVCEKWKVTGEFTCPIGENFNPGMEMCDWAELYPCPEDKPSSKCPKPNGVFPKPGSQCRSYYECINGKEYELQCNDDQLFNPDEGHCEWPELFSCDESKERTTSPSPGTTRITSTTTQQTSSTKETSVSTAKETTESTIEYSTPATKQTTVGTPTTSDRFSTMETVVTTNDSTDSFTGTETNADYTTLPNQETSSLTSTSSKTSGDYSPSPTKETSSRTDTTGKTNGDYSTLPTQETSFRPDTTGKTNGHYTTSPTQETSSRTDATGKTNEDYTTLPTQETSSYTGTTGKTNGVYTTLPTQEPSSHTDTTGKTNGDYTTLPTQETSSYTGTTGKTNGDYTTLPTQEPSSHTGTTGKTNGDYTTFPAQETSSRTGTTQSSGTSSSGAETTQAQTNNGCTVSIPETVQTTSIINPASIPTKSPDDIVCPGRTGVFPHPTDKHKFLSCLECVPTVMDCPDDLIFEPTVVACIWDVKPTAVDEKYFASGKI